MRWSKLKQVVEARFAPCLAGRIRLESTRYRNAHDNEGRWGLVIDGKEVAGMGCILADREECALHNTLKDELGLSPKEASSQARNQIIAIGHHNQFEFYDAVWHFTQSNIEDALASPDAMIRALAYLDARTGKRRLERLAAQSPSSDVERICLSIRLDADGIRVPGPSSSKDDWTTTT